MSDPLERIADALDRIADALERQAEVAASVVARIPPEGLSKEDAARFIGADVATIEHLIKTRKISYAQYGSQRGRLIPIEALRKLLVAFRQEAVGPPERNGK